MAKNHEKYEYYDVAVPLSNTLLRSYLEEIHTNTNIPEGQLLVQFATEHVKQVSSGQSNSLAGPGSLQAMLASMFSALLHQAAAVPTNGTTTAMAAGRAPNAVLPLGYDLMHNGAGDDDMQSAFGDPD